MFRRTRGLLATAFGVIALCLIATQLLVDFDSTETQSSINLIRNDALVSIKLVDRVAMDVDRERILFGQVILERDPDAIAAVERQLTAVRSDYEQAAREYAPLAGFPGERGVWQRLRAQITAMRAEAQPAIELARANRDGEATRALSSLVPRFESIHQYVKTLIDINLAQADESVARVTQLHDRDRRVRLLLVACTLVITYLVGTWATRTIVRSQRELEAATAELERRNRELDAFAGRVAHDLRGPLNTLSISTGLLVEQAPQAIPTTRIIERGVAQMTNLVEELLQLSRVGATTGEPSRIEDVADALEIDLAPLASQVGGAVRIKVEPALVPCTRGLLRQALWNLCENAIKYRKRDVPIAIDLVGRVRGHGYEIRISDNGVGMTYEDAQHVFEPFFRSPHTRSIPGVGLGLAIVRRIADACGGRITVASELGRGTTFEITLPLAAEVRSSRS